DDNECRRPFPRNLHPDFCRAERHFAKIALFGTFELLRDGTFLGGGFFSGTLGKCALEILPLRSRDVVAMGLRQVSSLRGVLDLDLCRGLGARFVCWPIEGAKRNRPLTFTELANA